jgi:hypothetical protein
VDGRDGGCRRSRGLRGVARARRAGKYYDITNNDLKYASKWGWTWSIETIASNRDIGYEPSIAIDAQGNPRISFYDATNGDLDYASAAIELAEPSPGVVWPVGASREVTWNGTGRADLFMSVDGGRSWDLLQSRVTGGSQRIVVPHAPSKFAQLKLERAVPYSASATPGLFTVQTSVSLLSLVVTPEPVSGVVLRWSTDPGPPDLAGYRVERAAASGWETLVALTTETSYSDLQGTLGSRYRLSSVNGLGEQLVLGEVQAAPSRPLAAWPLPLRSGSLNVSFATASGLGGGPGQADVALYDIQGRLVKRLAQGSLAPGMHMARWDGRDQHGEPVRDGVYYLRSRSGGETHQVKIAVLR